MHLVTTVPKLRFTYTPAVAYSAKIYGFLLPFSLAHIYTKGIYLECEGFFFFFSCSKCSCLLMISTLDCNISVYLYSAFYTVPICAFAPRWHNPDFALHMGAPPPAHLTCDFPHIFLVKWILVIHQEKKVSIEYALVIKSIDMSTTTRSLL